MRILRSILALLFLLAQAPAWAAHCSHACVAPGQASGCSGACHASQAAEEGQAGLAEPDCMSLELSLPGLSLACGRVEVALAGKAWPAVLVQAAMENAEGVRSLQPGRAPPPSPVEKALGSNPSVHGPPFGQA